MAISAKLFGKSMLSAYTGQINWLTADVTALLTDDSWTPSQDVHDFLNDVAGELSGGGYARVDLGTMTAAYDGATNSTYLGCAPFSFATMTGSYRYMVIFCDTGTPSTSPLIGWVDFGSLQSVTAQTVDITPPAEGLFAHTVVA